MPLPQAHCATEQRGRLGRFGLTVERPTGLPSVFVVGAAKSGTTAIYHYFKAHAQVFVPDTVKETNYMAFYGGLPPLAGPGDQKAVAATSVTRLPDYLRLFQGRATQQLAADVSPSYLYFPQAAQKIAQLCPRARIIMVLRNPVDAAFSMYSMMRRDRREPCRSFRAAYRRTPQRLGAGWQWFWDLPNGWMYSRQVAEYLKLFPRDQLFIRRYEDLKLRPHEFYEQLTQFLDIPPIDVAAANRTVNTSPRRGEMISKRRIGRIALRLGRAAGYFLPLSWRSAVRKQLLDPPAFVLGRQDRQMLVNHYRGDILQLAQMLSWDLSAWLQA